MNQAAVVYAGTMDVEIPDGPLVLTDLDGRVDVLSRALPDVSLLVLMDPLSFPVDAIPLGDVPVVVRIPDLAVADVEAVIGEAFLADLTPYDGVMTDDDALWAHLSQRFGLAESQRVADDPAVALGWSGPETFPFGDVRTAVSENEASRSPKAEFLALAAPVATRLRDSALSSSAEASIAVVATGTGPWLQVAQREDCTVTAFEMRTVDVAATLEAFPSVEVTAAAAADGLESRVEAFDAAVVSAQFGEMTVEARRTLFADIHRCVRPGGSIVVVGEFVARPGQPVVALGDFLAEVMEATLGQVTLHDVRAVRLPGESLHTSGVVTMARLGSPEIQ